MTDDRPGELGRWADWQQLAACRGADAELFFGPNRFEPKQEREAREAAAKEFCARCPVVDPCRETALRRGERYGVWGGLGEAERRSLLERLPPQTTDRAG